jgi:acyl-CoA synthetase (AMP-forming)/AMP-acid ligase II
LIQESGCEVTYGELKEYTETLASYIPARCLVFCICKNSIASVIGYVAFLNARIVPLMLDQSVDKELLDKLINVYQPKYLWVPSEMAGNFSACTSIYSKHDYTLIRAESGPNYELYEDLALLLTTSGSTGSRKLVRQSYKNIRCNADSIIECLEIGQTERAITTLPMSYTYGLSIINSYLQAGASIVVTGKALVQKEFWVQFKTFSATSFGGVPFTYEMLSKLRFFKMELPSLDVMTQAGGRLTAELHEKFSMYANETGKRFYVMYGQTEATARMSYLPHEKSLEKCGSIGIAIPNGQFFLVDEENNRITDSDTVGELGYIGENVCLGYAESFKDLANGDEQHGILLTGDLARIDDDGFYWVVGRKKRFLKVYGNRINLDEIEGILKDKYRDIELACSGVDDNIVVYVTDDANNHDLRQYMSEKTGLNRICVSIRHVPEIPKNESGKTIYAELDGFL